MVSIETAEKRISTVEVKKKIKGAQYGMLSSVLLLLTYCHILCGYKELKPHSEAMVSSFLHFIPHAVSLCLDISYEGREHRTVKLLKFRVVGSVILWLLFSASTSAYLPF